MRDGRARRHTGRIARLLVLLAFTVLLIPLHGTSSLQAAGTTFFVATNGNDSNSGTANAPLRTITKAVSLVTAGDTIIVRSGTYYESVNLGTLSGTPSNYIVIKSEVIGGAQIDTKPLGDGYNLEPFLGAPSYIEINGFDLTAGANSAGIQFDGGHHTRIINNIIHDAGASGIQANHGDYRYIEGNKTYRNGYYMYFAGSGISLWQADELDTNAGYHNIIRNNISYANDNLSGTAQTDGNGIIIDDFRNTQNGSTLGVYTPATLVENNLVYDNGGRGIQIYLTNNVMVRNNTAYRNNMRQDSDTWRGELNAAVVSDVTFANNIAVTDSSVNIHNTAIMIGRYGTGAMNNVIWRNNLTYDLNNPGNASYKIDGATTEVPTTANGNKLGVNPLFQDVAAANFQLQASSPAVNAGTAAYGAHSVDLSGNQRSVGSIDMGAYERQSGTYTENFNNNLAQNWTLGSGATLANGQLEVRRWGNSSVSLYNGATYSGSYVYKVDVRPVGQSHWNKTHVYFNYTDSNNFYSVEMDGATPNAMLLKKRVNGVETTLGTYSGGYATYNVWTTFEIQYVSGGTITVKATKNGTTTTLFNQINDLSLTSGAIGVGGQDVGADFDNIEVQ